jgi:4-methylaminobutanoate oxidase (formaldehyde-forming)
LSHEIGEFAPLAYAPHQYMIFEKIDGVHNGLPVTREYDHRFYFKPEVGSFMLGIFESQPIPHIEDFIMKRNYDGVPPDAENEVFSESYEKAGTHLEAAMEVFPVLQETGIRRWLHGPDVHSPDHGFVMGPMVSVDNAYIASGFNSQGIQCGPGVGLTLTEWILDGYPQTFKNHFQDLHVGRFNPNITKSDDWVSYRALEGYGGAYKPHMPREQVETVRGLALKSAFYDATVKSGGIFGETFGWERPLYFDPTYVKPEGAQNEWEELSPHPSSAPTPPYSVYQWEFKDSPWFEHEKAECLHCRNEVVAYDMSPFGKVTVEGKDALKLVQYAVTGQMDKPPGSITYTSFCLNTGGILGDLTVCREAADKFYCVLPAADPFVFQKHLRTCQDALGGGLDVKCTETTSDVATLSVMGPKSRPLMQALFPEVAWDNDAFPFGTFQPVKLGGVTMNALRISFAGELGWELHMRSDQAMQVYDGLFNKATESAIDLKDAGMWALLNSLRIEKGFVHNGHDIHPKITPMEGGLAFTVDWKKGDFHGRPALVEAKKEGPKCRLVSFKFQDNMVTPHGHYADLVYRDGEKVGYLSSTGYSHVLDAPIGMGFVDLPKDVCKKPKSWIEEGKYEIEIVHRGKIIRTPATASVGCLFDPKSRRAILGDYSSSEEKKQHETWRDHTYAQSTTENKYGVISSANGPRPHSASASA